MVMRFNIPCGMAGNSGLLIQGFFKIQHVIMGDVINGHVSINHSIYRHGSTVSCQSDVTLAIVPGHADGDIRVLAQVVDAHVLTEF